MNSVYASGTPAVLSATPAMPTFGTQSPTVNLHAGRNSTHLIHARVVIDMAHCTLSAQRSLTVKLRRTSGTPADVAHSSTVIGLGTIGTSGQSEDDLDIELPVVEYTKIGVGVPDTLAIFVSLDSMTGIAGQVRVTEASIVIE